MSGTKPKKRRQKAQQMEKKITVVAGSLPLEQSKKLIEEVTPKRKLVIVGSLDEDRMNDLKEVIEEMEKFGHEVVYLENPEDAKNYRENGYEFFDLSDIDKPKEPRYLDSASMSNRVMEITDTYAQVARFIPGPKKPQRILGYYNPETDKPQGRNEPCRCGSGKKFKHCCINKPKDK